MAGVERISSEENVKLVNFEEKYRIPDDSNTFKILSTFLKNSVKNFKCKNVLFQYFPILEILITYDIKGNLPNDIISGLIVGIIMIPQCMAYAALATLPQIVGLYIAFLSSITYCVFGTSRHLSWGCVAIVGLLMADVMNSYDNSAEAKSFIKQLDRKFNVTNVTQEHIPGYEKIPFVGVLGDGIYASKSNSSRSHELSIIKEEISKRRIEIAGGVSIAVGFILTAASLVGFNRITPIMSNSLITSFTVGIAFHVVSSQLKYVFGISVKTFNGTGRLFLLWADVIRHIPDTNIVVVLLTIISIIIMYLVKKFINERYKHRMRVPVPIELFVLIVSIIATFSLHLHKNHDVEIVGKVPIGLPKPSFPDLSLVTDYISSAMVIIIVSHAQSLAMAKTLGLELNYPIDSKQEMLAMGLSSVVCGMFSGFIPGASMSRSLVQSGSGGKTQVASLIAALVIMLVIMVIGPYFYYLPICIMSAIILVNIRGLFLKLLDIPSVWKKSKYDCSVWVVTCVATVILETGLALLVSIGFSVCLVLIRQVMNPVVEVGQIQVAKNDAELRSLDNYNKTITKHSVKLIKVMNPIYFFNSESFTNAVFEITRVNPIKVKCLQKKIGSTEKRSLFTKAKSDEETPILKEVKEAKHNVKDDDENLSAVFKTLILDLSQVAFLDLMGVQALQVLVHEYQAIGIQVVVTSVPENMLPILQRTGFLSKQKDRIFLNVKSALDYLVAEEET